jgi:hypothetical protein
MSELRIDVQDSDYPAPPSIVLTADICRQIVAMATCAKSLQVATAPPAAGPAFPFDSGRLKMCMDCKCAMGPTGRNNWRCDPCFAVWEGELAKGNIPGPPATPPADDPAGDEAAKLREAYECLYDMIKELPSDTDGEVAVYRCMRRRFEEAVGERFTRLLKERPEGQKLFGLRYDELNEQIVALRGQLGEVQDKYLQLIYGVARVFPGETRHETALRYIREAETKPTGPAMEKGKVK